jgi:hypothetical protein
LCYFQTCDNVAVISGRLIRRLRKVSHHLSVTKRAFEISGVILIVVMLLSLGIVFCPHSASFLYTSPDSPRRDGYDRERLLRPEPVQSFTPVDKIWTQTFPTERDGRNYLHLPQQEAWDKKYFPSTSHLLEPQNILTLGSSTLQLVGIGMAWFTAEQAKRDAQAPYRWFAPDGETPITPDLSAWKAPTCTPNFSKTAYWPHFVLLLKGKDLPDLKGESGSLYNPLTHRSIGNYQCLEQTSDGLVLAGTFQTWYNAPVDLLFDVPAGPQQQTKFLPKIGEGLRDGNLDIRLVSIQQDKVGGIDLYNGPRLPFIDISLQSQTGSNIWFFISQPREPIRCKFRFFDDKDQEIEQEKFANFVHGNVHETYLKRPVAEVKKIQASYWKAYSTVIIHIPEFPGLPAENHNLQDLSQMRVPYIKYASLSHGISTTGDLLQLGYRHEVKATSARVAMPSPHTASPASEVLEFENVTVSQIIQSLAKQTNSDVKIDNESVLWKRHETLWERALEKAQETYQRMRLKKP